MKTLDLELILSALPTKAAQSDIEKAVKERAKRLLYLMSLLEDEFITDTILAVPKEDWDIEEELWALTERSTPVAEYILDSHLTRHQYHRCYDRFRSAPLPKPKDFV